MGNYFSISTSETKESIKIINEIDHVHVIASGSHEHETNLNHENEIASNDFLNEQTQIQTETQTQIQTETQTQTQTEPESNVDIDIAEKQTQIGLSHDCVVFKKTNTKRKKCKKNKKHLQ